jgi:hypothetical protein
MLRQCFPVLGVVGALTGCVGVVHQRGPPQHEFVSFDRDSSELVRVHLKMGAGEMRVGGGTDKLARADFEFSIPEWKPQVSYAAGTLRISQPEGSSKTIGNVKYDWDVRLNREVPIEMTVNLGAGEAKLDIGKLTLRGVNVEMGVGSVDLDLRGQPKQDYSVKIRGGVGEATVHLPADVGIYAEARGGIGEISAPGLHHDGERYYNDAYRKSPVTVKLDVQGGVGSIKLISD